MPILVKTVRVFGLRGLQNIEVKLDRTTVLTGMNNSGKTSFLKAIQIALGNRQFITYDDFNISCNESFDKIIIDICIVPTNEKGYICENFDEVWEEVFTDERIRIDSENDQPHIPLRTVVSYDGLSSTYKTKKYILHTWPPFEDEGNYLQWYEIDNGTETSFSFDEIPLFYMDAQRDILEDIKAKQSYLGKMISKIEYDSEDVNDIEQQIQELNELAVSRSDILKEIKSTLKELNSAMDKDEEGVEITPFTKKIRDLNKGLSIYYGEDSNSFSMEYHGMGTRSWSSLLTLKSFINLLNHKAEEEEHTFFPILALEEPEAHLHPNAQKKLFTQIESVKGQKIISTHSPYIAASCELHQIINFYKSNDNVYCGSIDTTQLTDEEMRKIKRKVIHTRGEIFFSKAIILFEGETEEQALPIFAEEYFGQNPVELGIDFVGVGGYGNYYPFLEVAESMNINWVILSDGEKEAIKNVKKALKKLYESEVNLQDMKNVLILQDDCDFERYILESGYIDEIKEAFRRLHSDAYIEERIRKKDGTKKKRIETDEICPECSQNIFQDVFRDYSGDEGYKEALYEFMTAQKTQFGPVIAEAIIAGSKDIPPIIMDLFNQVSKLLKRNGNDE